MYIRRCSGGSIFKARVELAPRLVLEDVLELRPGDLGKYEVLSATKAERAALQRTGLGELLGGRSAVQRGGPPLPYFGVRRAARFFGLLFFVARVLRVDVVARACRAGFFFMVFGMGPSSCRR